MAVEGWSNTSYHLPATGTRLISSTGRKLRYDTSLEALAAIVGAPGGQEAAIRRYVSESGRCALCGVELSDPESVACGIGPVCAVKWREHFGTEFSLGEPEAEEQEEADVAPVLTLVPARVDAADALDVPS